MLEKHGTAICSGEQCRAPVQDRGRLTQESCDGREQLEQTPNQDQNAASFKEDTKMPVDLHKNTDQGQTCFTTA